MKKRRVIIALLLTIALPYSAVASIVDGGRCHHDSMAAHIGGGVPMHHDHAAMAHPHHAVAMLAGHDNCDCLTTCSCASHCGGGANSAALPSQPLESAMGGREEAMITDPGTCIPDTRQSPAFRPPIAALPSVA